LLARIVAFSGASAVQHEGRDQATKSKAWRRSDRLAGDSCNESWPGGIYLLVGSEAGPAAPHRWVDGQAEDGSRSLVGLYGELYQPMVRLAYLLTGSVSVAEDVVQDSFARLHQRWDRVRKPSAYLRASVVNACRAFHRRAHRERARFVDLVGDDVSAETPMVLDALAGLPYKQRAALVLRYWEDRPDAEIAEFLGCRPATVRSLVHRGLRALREVIEQ
jgi:RNA polymerase sigma factor (sigma-70 family)